MQGYLALTMLEGQESDVEEFIVLLRKDLVDMNEVHTCLALHALASTSHLVVLEALAEDALKLLVSPYVL